MKNLIAAVSVMTAFTVGWAPSALAAGEKPTASPLDFQACKFLSGKGMADLDEVSEQFRQYANKNDFAYSAWTLTPEYQSGAGYDVGWLGAWPDGESYGVSMEKWQTDATARALLAKFSKVMDCGGHHELSFSWPINAPDAMPTDGVLMIYECSLEDGKTLEDAYAAHLEFGTVKKGLGFLDNSWMFVPAIGSGDIDFDYRHAVIFYRYSDLGVAMDVYANGGGRQSRDKILAGTSSCKVPTLFNALSVRAYDER
jgi:hypothetical protein